MVALSLVTSDKIFKLGDTGHGYRKGSLDLRLIDQGSRVEDDQALDHIFQFPDITRPVIVPQKVNGVIGIHRGRAIHSLGLGGVDAVDQQGNIIEPLAQRRHIDGQGFQTVEKILSELSRFYAFNQVFIGRGDDTSVDLGGG